MLNIRYNWVQESMVDCHKCPVMNECEVHLSGFSAFTVETAQTQCPLLEVVEYKPED